MYPARLVDRFNRGPKHRAVIRQQRSQLRALIRAIIEVDKIVGHFLETVDVGVRHLFCHGDDPRKVGHTVATLSALDIPSQ